MCKRLFSKVWVRICTKTFQQRLLPLSVWMFYHIFQNLFFCLTLFQSRNCKLWQHLVGVGVGGLIMLSPFIYVFVFGVLLHSEFAASSVNIHFHLL